MSLDVTLTRLRYMTSPTYIANETLSSHFDSIWILCCCPNTDDY